MELYKYFREDYEIIDIDNNENYEVIDAFLDDLEDGNKRKYSEPLKAVFVHKTKHEMFLILDCLDQCLEKIEKFCEDWEYKVLNFVNFGNKFKTDMEFLKYNIFLIILCKDNIETDKDDTYRFQTEKSLKICRKIFLLCDDKGELIEDDKTIIPFYFEPLKTVNNGKTQKLEEKLISLLPKDNEMLSICEKKELTPEDIDKMCGWLNEHDNN